MRRTSVFCFILLVLLVFSYFSSTACAFDKDTHYYLKYYLLRKVGFCEEQASIIAKADQSTDSGKTNAGLYNKNNEKWHALASKEKNDARQEELWNRAQNAYLDDTKSLEKRLVPFGQFLHFLEDRTSHEGYGWRLGHGKDGHKPDYLSYYSMDVLEKAISEWLEYMTGFLWMMKGVEANPVTWDDVKDTVSKLRDANPSPSFTSAPKSSVAKGVINAALQKEIDPDESIKSPLYEYDEDGELIGTLPLEQFSITTVQQACNTLFVQDAITIISNSLFFSVHPEASVAIQWLNNFTEEQKVVDPSLNSLCYAITNLTGLAQDDEDVFNETTNLSLLMLDCVFKREDNVLYLRSEQGLSDTGAKMQEAYDALALVQSEIEKMETDPSDVDFELLANNLVTAWGFVEDAEFEALTEEDAGKEDTGKGGSTPGFELILILCAIVLVLFWKQKKIRSE